MTRQSTDMTWWETNGSIPGLKVAKYSIYKLQTHASYWMNADSMYELSNELNVLNVTQWISPRS